MTVHLIKLAVGVEDFEHLAQLQKQRMAQFQAQGLSANPRHFTRMKPKREAELLDGGSIYWVIKGAIRARQKLVAFDSYVDDEGGRRCAIVLDPQLVATQNRPHRAFQGWRYLAPAKAPKDSSGDEAADLPPELARDLEALGLL
ncbi:DUF1489 domain-containing protein [Magnetovibrio sp.]|uniref:DUF1489 family protein n=1 Tax=Magnetovibrio sp. TaxID=2024836 RepID=UPI002F94B086